MKLLILLSFCLGFVACIPKPCWNDPTCTHEPEPNYVLVPSYLPEPAPTYNAPKPAVHQIPRSFRTYLGSYSHQVGPTYQKKQGQNLAGNSNYGWKYDDYSGGWYQTGIVNPRK